MIRLICIDIDGTLVGSENRIPEAVKPAIEQARQRGQYLAICTGRPAMGLARQYAYELAPTNWHIFQSGSSMVQVSSGETRSVAMDGQWQDYLIHLSRQNQWVLELYSDTDYVVEALAHDPHEMARRHAELIGLPYTPRPFESLVGQLVRAQWVAHSDQLEQVLASCPPELQYSPATTPSMPDVHFISITPKGVDKCSGIARLADLLGVSLARTMMIGDGHNDIDALQGVGFSVAMGNAPDAVKAVARYVVGHVDQGGLAEALEMSATL